MIRAYHSSLVSHCEECGDEAISKRDGHALRSEHHVVQGFGLAMTRRGVKTLNGFILVIPFFFDLIFGENHAPFAEDL
jgi:hypothetical protein